MGTLDWSIPTAGDVLMSGLKVNNSLSGSKVGFVPQSGNVVNWYGCGPTVYDAAHMGHARNYVSFDILRRVMEDYFGYEVNMCMNITDIDDKIIQKANEMGVDFMKITRYWENAFFHDMKRLNCRLPDVITRVSEFLPEIVKFIESILENGFGYVSDGSVYFHTKKFQEDPRHRYGRMEPWSICEESRVLEGEGALSGGPEGSAAIAGKKTRLDFALWKKSKENEPSWDSPWGQGRPGWHIECSAMASEVLGFPLDIHSGGIDLRFPHHDNELAQSEAKFNRPNWVNYFLHSGHLHIKGLKMSKSLKNFITIDHILTMYSSRVVRILSLIHRWDQPMNYDPDQSMTEPLQIDKLFTHFFETMGQVLRKELAIDSDYTKSESVGIPYSNGLAGLVQKWDVQDRALYDLWSGIHKVVHDGLCDNFNTPLVMTKLQELVSAVNVYMRNKDFQNFRGPLLLKVTKYIHGILEIFGLIGESMGGLEYSEKATACDSRLPEILDLACEYRHKIRESCREMMKVLKSGGDVASVVDDIVKLNDEFRDDKMVEVGIRLEDKGDRGYMWKLSNREELMAEKEKRMAEEDDLKTKREERKRKLQEQETKKIEMSGIPPAEYFRKTRGNEFSEYDDLGLPTKNIDGTPVSKGQRDKMKKILEKHEKSFAK